MLIHNFISTSFRSNQLSIHHRILKFEIHLTASKIRYEITEGNYRGAFAVKNETGAIYVAGPLDYETRKEVSSLNFFLK